MLKVILTRIQSDQITATVGKCFKQSINIIGDIPTKNAVAQTVAVVMAVAMVVALVLVNS